MTTWDNALAAILGAVVGGAVGYFSASLIARRHSFNEAAAKFRAAFHEEQYRLEREREDVYKILDVAAYVRHVKARIEFEPYLSPGKLLALNETWERYYQYRNHVGQNVAPGSIDVRKTETPVASKILEEILEFAKPR